MKESILRTKSYAFALKIVKISRSLANDEKEYVLSRQILRSGTSIGANVEVGNQAQSMADFIHKMSIAHKEAFETNYWLRLLRDSGILDREVADLLIVDCEEIQKMLTASIKTSKSRISK